MLPDRVKPGVTPPLLPTRRVWLVTVVLLLACGGEPPAVADCPRGDLDTRYCDADGDLLADPPADEQALDPERIVFTYTPVEDPALYEGIWKEFTEHLARVTGRPVSYYAVNSYAAMTEAMRAGRLHVAGFATGSVPLGVNCAGFQPIATMGLAGDVFGYEMELITNPASGIKAPAELKGRRIAFTEESSNSGFRLPKHVLEKEFGLVEGRDYTAAFSGAHDASVLGVAHEDYDAAAIANEVLDRMVERDVVSRDELFTLYRSETFPTTAYGYASNLTADLRDKVREAFFTFPWEGTGLAKEFAGRADSFVPVSYAEAWSLVRTVARESGDNLTCP